LKLAYLIVAHRYPEQLARLVDSIYDESNYYLIHMDSKAGAECHAAVRELVRHYPNVSSLPSRPVRWCGYSTVRVILAGIRQLLRDASDWSFFLNLTGQDFPLQSQTAIRTFLKGHQEREFLEYMDPLTTAYWRNPLDRIQNVYVEVPWERSIRRVPKLRFDRQWLLRGASWYGGSEYMMLTRRFCGYLSSADLGSLQLFFRNTWAPSEGYFQTVVMNSPFKDTVINDNRRYIDWTKGPEGPRILRVDDMAALLQSGAFFARKFDATVDEKILDELERRLVTA
jgi:hypothetical protein